MRRRSIRAAIQVGVVALTVLAGCASDDRLQSSNAGKTTAFSPGSPDFDFEAVESIRDSTSGADLCVRIPWPSLVFVRDSGGFQAQYELRVKFLPEADSLPIAERTWERIVRSDGPVNSRSPGEQLDTHRVALPEGEYIAEAVVEDFQTGITAVRRQGITIFSSGDSCPRILRITLEHPVRSSVEPLLPLHIPEGIDSLRAVVTVRNPRNAAGGGLRLVLLRYLTDSLPSALPYYLSPTQGSLARLAVDFRRADTLLNRSVPFVDREEQRVVVSLAGLCPGYHEVVAECSVRACGTSRERLLRRLRGLAVVNELFPRVTTLRRMLEPLVYLATEKEYREIKGATTEEEMRAQFEKFWLHLGETPERSANLLKQYYTRVEEANLLYSAYKEGWKTDRGMIHVIFGPPSTIEKGNRQVIWSYPSGYAFLFGLLTLTRADEPFENWMLVRTAMYENAWAKEVDRWRRGQSF